ncbi:MAG: hypothetical protein ISR65_11060 [Bacteriovoracaceae bacterium]|nr:hypothetical protein [Bacteriovoracaceae bacterium]
MKTKSMLFIIFLVLGSFVITTNTSYACSSELLDKCCSMWARPAFIAGNCGGCNCYKTKPRTTTSTRATGTKSRCSTCGTSGRKKRFQDRGGAIYDGNVRGDSGLIGLGRATISKGKRIGRAFNQLWNDILDLAAFNGISTDELTKGSATDQDHLKDALKKAHKKGKIRLDVYQKNQFCISSIAEVINFGSMYRPASEKRDIQVSQYMEDGKRRTTMCVRNKKRT